LPAQSTVALEPRKSPVQARSTASVEAILEATVQVLLRVGKERLTTRMVAGRAGVSVGTLYQYFPNKSSLLQAVLKRHLYDVSTAVERVCREQHAKPLKEMIGALVTAFLEAKMKDARTSVALYLVSSDLDGAKIVRQAGARSGKAIFEMLSSATEPLRSEPRLVSEMLQGTLAGVSRRLLESEAPEANLESFRCELIFFLCAYVEKLSACSSFGSAIPG
jgi:AcrR family transcriptional regulator